MSRYMHNIIIYKYSENSKNLYAIYYQTVIGGSIVHPSTQIYIWRQKFEKMKHYLLISTQLHYDVWKACLFSFIYILNFKVGTRAKMPKKTWLKSRWHGFSLTSHGVFDGISVARFFTQIIGCPLLGAKCTYNKWGWGNLHRSDKINYVVFIYRFSKYN